MKKKDCCLTGLLISEIKALGPYSMNSDNQFITTVYCHYYTYILSYTKICKNELETEQITIIQCIYIDLKYSLEYHIIFNYDDTMVFVFLK